MKWLITGACNDVGRALLKILKSNNEYVIGVDVKGRVDPTCVDEFYTASITDYDALIHACAGSNPDVCVNLAVFDMLGKNFEEQRDVAINGTNNFFKICEHDSVKKIVYISSAIVYGGHADNPEYLYEADPLRSNDEYPYAKLKSIADLLAQKHAEQLVKDTIILRPVTIASSFFFEPDLPIFNMSFMFDFGKDIPFQFISVEDLASSIYKSVINGVSGIYNLSGHGVVETNKIARMFNKKVIKLSPKFTNFISSLAWNLKLSKVPPGVWSYFENRWTVDASKSWKEICLPRHTSEDVLVKYITKIGDVSTISTY